MQDTFGRHRTQDTLMFNIRQGTFRNTWRAFVGCQRPCKAGRAKPKRVREFWSQTEPPPLESPLGCVLGTCVVRPPCAAGTLFSFPCIGMHWVASRTSHPGPHAPWFREQQIMAKFCGLLLLPVGQHTCCTHPSSDAASNLVAGTEHATIQ